MGQARSISFDRGWTIMLRDLEINPEDVLRRARLPLEMLHQETSQLSIDEYFGVLAVIEEMADDPLLPIRLGQSARPETFSAPIFASLCSSSLVTAVQRIAAHKRLMAPVEVRSHENNEGLVVSWTWDDPTVRPPRLLMAMDLVFLTQLARTATREVVQPVRVTCPVVLEPADAYRDFFGVAPIVSSELSLTFSPVDAHRPFLTASESLWASFEPELQRRTNKLKAATSMTERIESILLECLPGGEGTLQQTARRLGVSPRTLQRRLADEGATFRSIVRRTRERLARHYLSNTALAYREISFLLGFDEQSSFFRAFHEWSGHTPESFRTATRSDAE